DPACGGAKQYAPSSGAGQSQWLAPWPGVAPAAIAWGVEVGTIFTTETPRHREHGENALKLQMFRRRPRGPSTRAFALAQDDSLFISGGKGSPSAQTAP